MPRDRHPFAAIITPPRHGGLGLKIPIGELLLLTPPDGRQIAIRMIPDGPSTVRIQAAAPDDVLITHVPDESGWCEAQIAKRRDRKRRHDERQARKRGAA